MPDRTESKVLNVGTLLKIYSNNDIDMNKVGKTLASTMSRKIYGILIEKELNAKEVAKIVYDGETLHLSNVVSILHQMVKAGLITREKKLKKIPHKNRTGYPLSFYKGVPFILIMPPAYVKKISKNNTLQNTLQNIFSTF